ncbi:MAG: radical SAM protein [Chloroflexota bacterium]|nr:MAG: radical SAM protein [Chloroflexota bacterium]
MTSIRESVRRRFAPISPIEPGVYHFQAPQEDPRNYRLHLRIEKNGDGVMIVNASTILHLNQTATEYAYYLVQGMSEKDAANTVASRYRVSYDQALQDYSDFLEQIDTLVTIPDLDPVAYLGFERTRPYTGELTAPYRLDCALTYQLPPGIDPQFAPHTRADRNLSTEEWHQILDKAWQAGIPHVIFTGGEPTLREDLQQLIVYAEQLGQVTGLLTDGVRLMEEGYFDSLLQTGLDHMLYLLQPDQQGMWDTIKAAAESDIFTTVHLSITPQDQEDVNAYLERLAEMGVTSISLSASSEELVDALVSARELAANLDLSLVWDTPVPYSSKNPFALEFKGRERPPGAGHAWLYVEPDGDVLPDQDINIVLGNFLEDSWENIWAAAQQNND